MINMDELEAKATIEDCYCGYGRDDFILSVDDIKALAYGKALSGDINCGEFGITISADDKAIELLRGLL